MPEISFSCDLDTSEQALYRLLRFFTKIRARLRRCSSFPNRTRCRWAPVWFLGNATSPVSPLAPRRSKLCIACSDFFQKSERACAAAPPFQTGPAAAGLRFGFSVVLQSPLCSGLFFCLRLQNKPYARAFVLPFPQKVTLRRNKLRAFQFFGMIVLSKKARLLRGGFSFL